MARITLYVVETFVDSEDGLVAEAPFERRTAVEAALRAQTLSIAKAGVVAWAKSGDPDIADWDDDTEILFKAGRTGS
jgi:hypothetical protein